MEAHKLVYFVLKLYRHVKYTNFLRDQFPDLKRFQPLFGNRKKFTVKLGFALIWAGGNVGYCYYRERTGEMKIPDVKYLSTDLAYREDWILHSIWRRHLKTYFILTLSLFSCDLKYLLGVRFTEEFSKRLVNFQTKTKVSFKTRTNAQNFRKPHLVYLQSVHSNFGI